MELQDIKHIGVVGAGLMGHGIAQVFASAGYRVSLYDSDPATLASAKERIAANCRVFVQLGLAKPEEIEVRLDRISLCPSLEALCDGPQYLIEAVLEDIGVKRKVYKDLERFASPDAILSSNTSAISITEIGDALQQKERFLGTHFWNPPHILPCVEVIKGAHTGEKVFETICSLLEKTGKVPVRVMKDVPGFLGNRLQHAMWREAVALCENGIASAEDIDKVVKYGLGLRMPFLGPLETADLAGLDLTFEVHKYLFPHLDASTEPSPLLTTLVARGERGAKSGRGFYPWPPEKLRRIIEARDGVLLKIIHEIVSDAPTGAADK
ncbi:MAG: 3-hydroxyacyl-CoA dehydrogenase family protein [Syntrophobacteraceae bacterium]